MRALHSVLLVLVAAVLAVGCVSKPPGWTAAPRPSNGAAGAASVAASAAPTATNVVVAQPTPAPGGATADVLPVLTPKAQLQPVPVGRGQCQLCAECATRCQSRPARPSSTSGSTSSKASRRSIPNGLEYTTWGYRLHGDEAVTSGTPGPIIRARVGDVLRFTITNLPGNSMPHNVDFHAVTGQGGGAADTTVNPGETATIEARLLYPGIFMYHCAAGDVPSTSRRACTAASWSTRPSRCRRSSTSCTWSSRSTTRPNRRTAPLDHRSQRRSPTSTPPSSSSTAPLAR